VTPAASGGGRSPRLLLRLSLLAVALLGLAAAAGPADAGGRSPREPAVGPTGTAQNEPAVRRSLALDRHLTLLRLGLIGLGMGLAVWRWRAPAVRSRTRCAAVVALGLVSYASYYQFFLWHHRGGFDAEDTFHYYVGSKYFSELGYTGLYEATLLALHEQGKVDLEVVERVRDLRTLRAFPSRHMLERARRWKRDFTPARWEAFRHDVAFFRARMKPRHLAHLMIDNGYQPSPVWTLVGGIVTNAVPVDSPLLRLAVQSDRLFVLLGLAGLAWGFGLEIAAFVAVAWGTGFLWRFGWVGDSLLRHLWLASLWIGLALARRGRDATAGAVLAFPSLLRLFPLVFPAGWVARALREAWQQRRVPAALWRFAAGGILAATLLLGASFGISPRGPAVYADFAAKITTFARNPASNKMGLQVLLGMAEARAPVRSIAGTQVTRPAPWATNLLRVLRWIAVAGFAWLFWRALVHAKRWEAAAMAFALIPVLAQPTNYYFSFATAGVLLGFGRPRILIGVLAACFLWAVGGLVWYRQLESYVVASGVALVLSAFVLIEMRRPATPEARLRLGPRPAAVGPPPSPGATG
jgi:hypothetical protein